MLGVFLENSVQIAFGYAEDFRKLLQCKILFYMPPHIPNDFGYAFVLGLGAAAFFPLVGFRKDQLQHLGDIDEISFRIVGVQHTKKKIEKEMHPVGRVFRFKMD